MNILFFSLEHWDDIWRRNQLICNGLLERYPDAEILWVGPQTDLWNRRGLASVQLEVKQPRDRLHIIKPFKPLPNIVGKSLNDALLKQQVLGSLTKLGWKEFTVWVNNQSVRSILPLPGSTRVIYDITDDWTKASLPPRILNRTKEDDEWLLDNADSVIVCSQGLYDSKIARRKELELIRNGVNVSAYLPDTTAKLLEPPDLNFAGPIAGYIGTLHEDRLDIPLVMHLLNALPNIQFVFIGPNSLAAETTQLLLKAPNCHLLGSRPYADLPAYMGRFDVCINPHLVSEFTESLDPVKMYEYMATGKPIISTDCAGFRELASLISIAKDPDQFAELIKQSLEKPEVITERIAWAQEQSWDRRLDQVERVLGRTKPLTVRK